MAIKVNKKLVERVDRYNWFIQHDSQDAKMFEVELLSIHRELNMDRVRTDDKLNLLCIASSKEQTEEEFLREVEKDYGLMTSMDDLIDLAETRTNCYFHYERLKNPHTILEIEALEELEKYMDKLCLKR